MGVEEWGTEKVTFEHRMEGGAGINLADM